MSLVCSEINFSESLCFIGTSQFISSIHDLTRFCLMWVFEPTELNLRTHLRAIYILFVPFYKLAFYIIYLIRFSIIDVSSYREGFRLFVFDPG